MAEAERVPFGMKWTMLTILLCGSLVGISAPADDAKGTHSRWVIILTLTDTTSGKLIEQRDLDAELEFDDAIKCESILARVRGTSSTPSSSSTTQSNVRQ